MKQINKKNVTIVTHTIQQCTLQDNTDVKASLGNHDSKIFGCNMSFHWYNNQVILLNNITLQKLSFQRALMSKVKNLGISFLIQLDPTSTEITDCKLMCKFKKNPILPGEGSPPQELFFNNFLDINIGLA